jgi:FkbM family methyltransferase
MTYVPPPFLPRLKSRIKQRIVNLRHRYRLSRDGREIFDHCRFFGADFMVRLDDHIGYEMAIGIFEWVQLDRLIRTCERIKPDVFLDIGAHTGLYTCVMGRRGLAPRLIAFEPDRRTLVNLKANLLINDLLARTELHEAAVGAERGTAMFVQGGDDNRGQSRIEEGHPDAYAVPVVAIDDVVQIEGKTLAIKMDVEGFEMETLAGGERLFRENGGYAQIEAYDGRDAVVIPRMAELGWRLADRLDIDFLFEKS